MQKVKSYAEEYTVAAEIDWLWKYIPASKRDEALPLIGHELVAISKQIERPVLDTLSIVYNSVHASPQDAVTEFKRRLDNDPQYFAKYRYEPLGF